MLQNEALRQVAGVILFFTTLFSRRISFTLGGQCKGKTRLCLRCFAALEKLRFAPNLTEKTRRLAKRLRRPQKEVALLLKRVVKEVEDALLQFAVKVDEQIAAGDEVEPGKGRVFDEVVRGEEYALA